MVYAWFTHGLRSLRNVLQFAQLICGFVQFAQFAQFAQFWRLFRLNREYWTDWTGRVVSLSFGYLMYAYSCMSIPVSYVYCMM